MFVFNNFHVWLPTLQMFLRFNATNIRFPSESPALPTRQFTCTTDAISPSPSIVQNFSLNSYELQDLLVKKLFLNFSWVPPVNPNGILKSYTVCMSQRPLGSDEEPFTLSGVSVCETINVSTARGVQTCCN